jgi:hypothetical protein
MTGSEEKTPRSLVKRIWDLKQSIVSGIRKDPEAFTGGILLGCLLGFLIQIFVFGSFG